MCDGLKTQLARLKHDDVTIPDLLQWSNTLGLEMKYVALVALESTVVVRVLQRQSRRLSRFAEYCDKNVGISASTSRVASHRYHFIFYKTTTTLVQKK